MKASIGCSKGLAILVVVLGLYLTGCGTPMCIAGVGDGCGYDPKVPVGAAGSPGSATGASSDIAVATSAPSITVGNTVGIIMSAYGGTAPYTYSIVSPTSGGTFGATISGSTFMPPQNTITPPPLNNRLKFILQAKDRNGVFSNNFTIWVTQ